MIIKNGSRDLKDRERGMKQNRTEETRQNDRERMERRIKTTLKSLEKILNL